MDGENFVPATHYGDIKNASELPAAAVFLTWLAVGDQEGHNQFLQRKVTTDANGVAHQTKYFKLIDMGQAFGSFSWNATTIAAVPAAYALPPHMVPLLSRAALAPVIDQLKHLTDDDIRGCLSERPNEWGIDDADVSALLARLLAARDIVDTVLFTGNPGL
jgi:hypothetical protein